MAGEVKNKIPKHGTTEATEEHVGKVRDLLIFTREIPRGSFV
jgi:hypothetical protein